MRFLVTGGAGFIGSHLAEALLREGHAVRILDNFVSGSRANLAHLREVSRGLPGMRNSLETIVGDIRDGAVLRRGVRDVDVVLHQAALPSVPRSVSAPETTHDVNVTGTLNVLLACRDAGVRRVVFASSSSVYGNTAALPKHEGMMPQPLSPYAVSKLAGEHYCQVFRHLFGLETVCLRYFNVFGPRQNPNSQYAAVIPRFTAAVMRGESPTVYGDGRQTRDFTYVENVVQANLLAATAEAGAGVYNVACGERISLLEVLGEISALLGTATEPEFAPAKAGDVRDSYADIRLASERLGYRPAVSFGAGLRRTIEWFRREVRVAALLPRPIEGAVPVGATATT